MAQPPAWGFTIGYIRGGDVMAWLYKGGGDGAAIRMGAH